MNNYIKLIALIIPLLVSNAVWSEDNGIDWRIEAQSQAAGTPNQAGIGAFVPLGSEGFILMELPKPVFRISVTNLA